MMQAIETVYKGYRFRSRLEARYAVFFDMLGIQWEYEPQGYKLSDATLYLPDFYLTESDSFFEVKGIMTDFDMHKVKQLIKDSGKACSIGYPDLSFQACDNWWDDTFELCSKEDSVLARCRECGKRFFIGMNGAYSCPCCRYYDGNSTFVSELEGIGFGSFGTWFSGEMNEREKDIERATRAFKQARFEHGENGVRL